MQTPNDTDRKPGRGRPVGSTNQPKETLYTYTSANAKCACKIKSGLSGAIIYCEHYNRLTRKG